MRHNYCAECKGISEVRAQRLISEALSRVIAAASTLCFAGAIRLSANYREGTSMQSCQCYSKITLVYIAFGRTARGERDEMPCRLSGTRD